MNYEEYKTDFGTIRIVLKENGNLVRVVLTEHHWRTVVENQELKKSVENSGEVRRQLQEYFEGKRKYFEVPFEMKGTPFQKEVWSALQSIPYGETTSYSEIASILGRPQAVRAVGHANSINPLPIIFPCHRVIGKNKTLTGYAGGMEMKKKLLQLEGASF
ncbi:methylated-DNA--[protein]-cysteine S-methyltransferase [Alteribacillus sp. HJP-4]|uniref:methylated-DNA--[protein]-cysteine S-methyltransferase n=1 Tax=Alteribacillus sp. HJP-4 TaxID=2775394 RepID=UPI0035CD2258